MYLRISDEKVIEHYTLEYVFLLVQYRQQAEQHAITTIIVTTMLVETPTVAGVGVVIFVVAFVVRFADAFKIIKRKHTLAYFSMLIPNQRKAT